MTLDGAILYKTNCTHFSTFYSFKMFLWPGRRLWFYIVEGSEYLSILSFRKSRVSQFVLYIDYQCYFVF